MRRILSILGSSGSIGRQALDVAEVCGHEVAAITVNRSAPMAEEQARRFRPRLAVAVDEDAAAAPLADWGLVPVEWRKKIAAKHIFTHVEWRMTGYLLTVKGDGAGLTWADRGALESLAVPSAFGKFLAEAVETL